MLALTDADRPVAHPDGERGALLAAGSLLVGARRPTGGQAPVLPQPETEEPEFPMSSDWVQHVAEGGHVEREAGKFTYESNQVVAPETEFPDRVKYETQCRGFCATEHRKAPHILQMQQAIFQSLEKLCPPKKLDEEILLACEVSADDDDHAIYEVVTFVLFTGGSSRYGRWPAKQDFLSYVAALPADFTTFANVVLKPVHLEYVEQRGQGLPSQFKPFLLSTGVGRYDFMTEGQLAEKLLMAEMPHADWPHRVRFRLLEHQPYDTGIDADLDDVCRVDYASLLVLGLKDSSRLNASSRERKHRFIEAISKTYYAVCHMSYARWHMSYVKSTCGIVLSNHNVV